MNNNTYSFPQIFGRQTYKTELSEDNKSINESLGILLRTRPGELFGDPEYGCNLINRIFAYNGLIIEDLIKQDILDAVNKYEKRITMSANDIIIEHDVHTVKIYIQYTIKASNDTVNYYMEVNDKDYNN